jgi:glycosyltransferase involved in cell wall biosynthesis
MRIVQITPGTGNFHCGSCLRDLAMVKELRRRGHDVVVVPLYLPLVSEDDSLPDSPIFFGGINVYLQHKLPLLRHTPRWMDRWLDSPGLLRRATRGDRMTSARDLGELTLSMLQGEEGTQVKELRRLVDWLQSEPPPDILCLSNLLLAGMAGRLKKALGCPVVCTAHGEDGFLDSLASPYREQAWDRLREDARAIDLFIPVSAYYAGVVRDRVGVAPDRIRHIHNGIDLEGFAARDILPDPPVIGYLARLCAVKGLGTLVQAYVRLRANGRVPGAQLHVAGAMTAADQAFVDAQRHILDNAGCAADVRFLPNLSREEKLRFLRELSVFSVPATYGESFGMYVVEALACGVPVVQPDHAAFPELIAETGGGLLCAPDDPAALAEGLETLLLDPERNRRLGEAGRIRVLEHFSVGRMADDVLHALTDCLAHARHLAVAAAPHPAL